MFAIYLKSSDEKTIVKVMNQEARPVLSEWYSERGYTEIDQKEFDDIRQVLEKKQRQTHGFTHDEKELQANLVHLQAQRNKTPSPHDICGRKVVITDMKNGRFVYETNRDESGYVTADDLNTAIYKIAEGLH